MNTSIPTTVVVAAWVGLLTFVAAYTVKAFAKTAKDLPNGPAGSSAPVIPDIPANEL